MPKPLELTMDTMIAPPVPKAALAMAESHVEPRQGRAGQPAAKTESKEPLQVRWPSEDVKAVKLATIQMDFDTVSEFMLACFHAYMQQPGR